MTIEAKGENYFENINLPVAVKHIEPGKALTHPHDLTFQKHFHNFNELVIITHGSGLKYMNGFDFEVKAGDIFLLKGKEEHYFKSQSGLALVNIMYLTNKLFLPEIYLRELPGYRAFFELEPWVRNNKEFKNHLQLSALVLRVLLKDVREIESLIQNKSSGYELEVFTLLIKIMTLISREYSVTQNSGSKSLLRISDVLAIIETEYDKKWVLKDFSKIAHMSPNNLMNIFHKAGLESPVAYLNSIRLQKAASLLKESDFSVTEIALKVGFNDSSYFSRAFSAQFGVSPKNFRNSKT